MSIIKNLLTLDYIYIPYQKNAKLLIQDGENVFKNDAILEYNNRRIFSTVSGKVLGMTSINNNRYVVIENDYKDKTRKKLGSIRNIDNIKKEDFISLIDDYNIIDNFDENSKVLIINGIDRYNEEFTYNTLLKEFNTIILDSIDAIVSIMSIKKCFFAISNSDTDAVNMIINNIGTYPKIDLKLFNNDNMIGVKEFLINELTSNKNKKYNIQYLDLIDVINIYNVLKKHIPVTTTYISLIDKINNTKKILHINIGSNLKDIITEYRLNDKKIVINGLINGIKIKNPNFIIDKSLRSIFVTDLKEYKKLECINCGLCYNICPIGINPKYMYFNNDSKAKKYKEACVKCGMCEYICPSKIDLIKKGNKNE